MPKRDSWTLAERAPVISLPCKIKRKAIFRRDDQEKTENGKLRKEKEEVTRKTNAEVSKRSRKADRDDAEKMRAANGVDEEKAKKSLVA
ncbi:MAG: hypothetical protein Q9161_007508 [Pseudevernia consocians]